jgi:signal transduction histidine kinase
MKTDSEQATIMIVDDEPENLNVLESLLTREGYQVEAFPQGELALAAARVKAPDLVLLDIRMPGIDGYEVCRRFKEDALLRALPILFISALSAADEITAGFQCGGVDYIGKPFRGSEVVARVRTHLALRRVYLDLEREHHQLILLEHHRDMLTHMLVHDMRGPLQVIGGHLELLGGSGQLQADGQANLRAASQGVRSLSQMVSTVVDLSRMETIGIPLQPVALAVADLIHSASSQALDPANGRRLVIQLADDCPNVLADYDLSVRVVANLLLNAFKHAPDGKFITVGSEADPNGVRIWVRDEGAGIPVDDQQRIFERFGVASRGAGTSISGTGLGLAFCRLAVEAQGGKIGVDSRPGAGSTFWFTLPTQ